MKKIFFIAAVSLVLLSFKNPLRTHSLINATGNDTVKIMHVPDGDISEWPADKFTQDKDTEIWYAVDNDATSLHVAMKIQNTKTQMKLMRQGMNLYIDVKGRKREATGVAFPMKMTQTGAGSFNPRQMAAESDAKPDMKAARQSMATNLIFLKSFGMEGQDDMIQPLSKEKGVTLGFGWDEADVMYIEYSVPVALLGGNSALAGKKISLGCKINGMEMAGSGGPVTAVASPLASGGGRGGGGRGGGAATQSSGAFGPGAATQGGMAALQEQSFWAKYDVKL